MEATVLRLLHISDVHFNAGYASKSESVRLQMKEAHFETLKTMFEFVIREALDGILIAGDLFDHEKINFREAYFVLEWFNKLLEADVAIYYSTGNHDPMYSTPFIESLRNHPLFHIFENDEETEIRCVAKDSTAYRVIGVGHKSKNEQRNLIRNYPPKSDDEIWIGIGHASVPSALTVGEKESYMATSLSDIEALNYDYFALGHIHVRQMLTSKIGYSGNPQGMNSKETGPKGGLLITVDHGHTQVLPVNFNKIQWESIAILISPEINNLDDLIIRCLEGVTQHISSVGLSANRILGRIWLSGKTPLKKALEIPDNRVFLERTIKDRTGLMYVDIKLGEMQSVISKEPYLAENTVLAQILRRLDGFDCEAALMEQLYKLPIYSKQMSKDEKQQQLVSMQTQLIEEILQRMVIETDDN